MVAEAEMFKLTNKSVSSLMDGDFLKKLKEIDLIPIAIILAYKSEKDKKSEIYVISHTNPDEAEKKVLHINGAEPVKVKSLVDFVEAQGASE